MVWRLEIPAASTNKNATRKVAFLLVLPINGTRGTRRAGKAVRMMICCDNMKDRIWNRQPEQESSPSIREGASLPSPSMERWRHDDHA